MPFKPQIKLLVASKEDRWQATIPNPSEEERAAFVWLSFTPSALKPAVEAYKAAVREHLAKPKIVSSVPHSPLCLGLREAIARGGEEDCPDVDCPWAK